MGLAILERRGGRDEKDVPAVALAGLDEIPARLISDDRHQEFLTVVGGAST